MYTRIPTKHLSSNYALILKSFKVKLVSNEYETIFAAGKEHNSECAIYLVQKTGGSISKILLGYLPACMLGGISIEGFSKQMIRDLREWHFYGERIMHDVPFSFNDLGVTGVLLKQESVVKEGGVLLHTYYYVANDTIYVSQRTDKGIVTVICGYGKEAVDKFTKLFMWSPYKLEYDAHFDIPVRFGHAADIVINAGDALR